MSNSHYSRNGLPPMSKKMLAALGVLKEAKENDNEWVLVSEFNKQTLQAVYQHDWVFISYGDKSGHPDQVKITGRGMRAFNVYSTPSGMRFDGICTCGKAPKHYYSNGKTSGYCLDCARAKSRRRSRLGLMKLDPKKKCSRCRKKARHVTTSGYVSTYCPDCKRSVAREGERKRRVDLYQRWLAGEVMPCNFKGCNQQRHVFGKTVRAYCHEHSNIMEQRRRKKKSSKEAFQRVFG